jgi:hypothetical protein
MVIIISVGIVIFVGVGLVVACCLYISGACSEQERQEYYDRHGEWPDW